MRAMLAAIGMVLAALPASAQSPSPGYLVVVGQSSDREKMGRYASALPPIYAKHEGYYLGIGGPGRGVTWLDGPWANRSLVLGRFPSRAEVDQFWWDEDYRQATRLRDAAGVFSVLAAEGAGETPFQGPEAGFLVVMLSSKSAEDSQDAAERFTSAVTESGGVVMTPTGAPPSPLEGDTVFDRLWIAAWPSKAARAAFLESRSGQAARRAWNKAGFAAAATIDGVPRAQRPPAASAPAQAGGNR
jgi:uncharacterized protein (DUF1330 family)